MVKYFGTDGIRGCYGQEPMTANFAYRLAIALAQSLETPSRIVLGRDTRASGRFLERALYKGFKDLGHSLIVLGEVPTPAVAMQVLCEQASLGIVLTASHNPAQDNGIKLFNHKGEKLAPEEEAVIEAKIDSLSATLPEAQESLEAYLGADFYVKSLLEQMNSEAETFSGMKIVLDCANGATYQTSPAVLKALGAEVFVLGDSPDGNNINQGLGSEHPAVLEQKVLEVGADIGLAHDGDGDRLLVVDELGAVVDGDHLLATFAIEALKEGQLKANTLVVTEQSNLAVDCALQAAGGSVERVPVGDRNVATAMRRLGANIGGESSGHILFTDYSSTGDGLLAALQLLKIVKKSGQAVSTCVRPVELFSQKTKNLSVQEKIPFDRLPNLITVKASVESELGDKGRVLMRYSGTESKLRLLVEAENSQKVEQMMQILVTEACKSLAVI